MKKALASFSIFLVLFSSYIYADESAIKHSLNKLGITIGNIHSSPISGLKLVLTNRGIFYITEDGKYIIQGIMYDFSGVRPINIANSLLIKHLNVLEKEMIVYKSTKEKHIITVFTDITCVYCRKLHKEMKNYNDLGITVRYLAFPHTGIQSKLKQDMQAIWCAKDRHRAFDSAIKGKSIQHKSCDIDITKHYALGIQFGVTGTPAIILSDGYMIPGYQNPQKIRSFINDHLKY